jgi:hypothetical protein
MSEQTNEQVLTHVWCSVELFNSIITVLQTQPYNTVATVMENIQKGVKPMHPETLKHADSVLQAIADQKAGNTIQGPVAETPSENPPAGPANG